MSERLKQLLSFFGTKIKQHPKISATMGIVIALGFLIRNQQRKIIYMPKIPGLPLSPAKNPYPYQSPMQQGLWYDAIQIKTSDNVTLKGWYVQSTQDWQPQRIILYYHQNAGNIGTRLPYIKNLIHETHSDVMIVAYRGYSDSDGKPTEKGIKIDGIQILNAAMEKSVMNNLPIVVLGRSLGGAVAINSITSFRQQKRIKGIILENTFTSISDVALHLFGGTITRPLIRFFLLFLLSNHWQSYKKIGELKIPVLFIKSALDELIPIEQMNKLENLCQARKSSFVIPNGTHNETWTQNRQAYFSEVNKFISSL